MTEDIVEYQTPLVDLLRATPEDARLIYEHSPTHSQSIPVGRHAKEAAEELKQLSAELVISWDTIEELKRQLRLRVEANTELQAELAAVKLQLGVGGQGDVVAASGAAVQVAVAEMNRLRAKLAEARELLRSAPIGSEFRTDWEPWIAKRNSAMKEGK